MSGPDRADAVTANDLRRAFDGSFAVPPARTRQEAESFLALTIGGDGYAVRVREIAGLTAARKIVPIASPIVEMLGLAGIRGTIVPVYSLAAMLGYARDTGTPRWFVLCKGTDQVALAFADLDGYLEHPRTGVSADEGGTRENERKYVREVLREASGARGVIGIAPLMDAIAARAGGAVPAANGKEP